MISIAIPTRRQIKQVEINKLLEESLNGTRHLQETTQNTKYSTYFKGISINVNIRKRLTTMYF